jgi:hypothetical protein
MALMSYKRIRGHAILCWTGKHTVGKNHLRTNDACVELEQPTRLSGEPLRHVMDPKGKAKTAVPFTISPPMHGVANPRRDYRQMEVPM